MIVLKTIFEGFINIISFGIYKRMKQLRAIKEQENDYKKELLQYQMEFYKDQRELRGRAELKTITRGE